jgi:hypothetical protein
MKSLLKLYPRRWRERYGAELEAFLDATSWTPRLLLDLLKGAVDANLNPDLAVRRFALIGSPAAVFVPNIGFRSTGLRLAHPLRHVEGDRTLLINHLVCTSAMVDISFDVTDAQVLKELPDGPMRLPLKMDPDFAMTLRHDRLSFRMGDRVEQMQSGPGDTYAIPGGIRRTWVLRPPLPLDVTDVELQFSSAHLGKWSVPLALVPLAASEEVRRIDVVADDTHGGVTIAVRGLALSEQFTAVDLSMSGPADVECAGIGGLDGMRQGPSALLLRDQTGRTYAEVQRPFGMHVASSAAGDGAYFEPIAAGVEELELVVPFAYLRHDRQVRVDIALPVTSPAKVMFGDYPITVVASAPVPDNPGAPARHRGPGLGFDLDLGSWQGDRRVLVPTYVVVDDRTSGFRYTKMFRMSAPEPVDRLEVPMQDAQDARKLTLCGPTVQVRGPWRIRFPVARSAA